MSEVTCEITDYSNEYKIKRSEAIWRSVRVSLDKYSTHLELHIHIYCFIKRKKAALYLRIEIIFKTYYKVKRRSIWGGWEGGSKGWGYTYTYGWFMLRFDRKQNSVKQLSFNKKINKFEKTETLIEWMKWIINSTCGLLNGSKGNSKKESP